LMHFKPNILGFSAHNIQVKRIGGLI
jgi:hypothetical protein